MSADSFKSFDVLLMINEDTGELFPFSSHGFHFAQGTIRSVVRRSQREVFLNSQGILSGIAGVRPVDDGYAAMLKRLLGFSYAVYIKFEPRAVEFTAFKKLLLIGLQDYQSKLDGDESWRFALQPFPDIEALVLAAENTEILYTILELPEAENCLDLL